MYILFNVLMQYLINTIKPNHNQRQSEIAINFVIINKYSRNILAGLVGVCNINLIEIISPKLQ